MIEEPFAFRYFALYLQIASELSLHEKVLKSAQSRNFECRNTEYNVSGMLKISLRNRHEKFIAH